MLYVSRDYKLIPNGEELKIVPRMDLQNSSMFTFSVPLSGYGVHHKTFYIINGVHFKYLPITAETPKPIMNPHNNPKIIQPTNIPVQSGLSDGFIFKNMVIAATTIKAAIAHIQKVNRSIIIVNNQK